VAGAFIWLQPRQYEVTLTPSGFEPQELTIRSGDTVIFRNTTDRAFWPASNFHPSHKLYPEFDPQKPIAAGGSWGFHFSEAGVWRYHDHLNSRHTAVIVVQPNPLIASAVHCGADIDTLPVKVQERCWIQGIENALVRHGVDAAFKLFSQLYEEKSAFSSDCHDVTHLLGEAAYRDYVKRGSVTDAASTAYCGYGFYHGFIEALLFTTENFQQAKSYCLAVQEKLAKKIVSPNAIYSCYHGLGHGTFDTQSFSEWGSDEGMLASALARCEQVTQGEEPELVKQCATGVFNALANAYNNKTYNLSFDPSAPWAICSAQMNVEYKKACFREVAASYIKGIAKNTEEALRRIMTIQDGVGARETMIAFMSEEARLRVDTSALEELAATCESPWLGELRQSCALGVGMGFFLWGKPGHEHEKAVAFCMQPLLDVMSRDACMEYVVSRIRTVYNKQKVSEVCATIPSMYQQYCQ